MSIDLRENEYIWCKKYYEKSIDLRKKEYRWCKKYYLYNEEIKDTIKYNLKFYTIDDSDLKLCYVKMCKEKYNKIYSLWIMKNFPLINDIIKIIQLKYIIYNHKFLFSSK
jgi:hypothetical protein